MDNLVSEWGVLGIRSQNTGSNQKLNAHREFLTWKVPFVGGEKKKSKYDCQSTVVKFFFQFNRNRWYAQKINEFATYKNSK